MAAKKAQMFVATAVFLTGLLFVVQQALVIYSVLDLTMPFQAKDSYIVTNLVDLINYTIMSQPDTGNPTNDCLEFEGNLKELISFLRDDYSKRGYLLLADYSLDCDYWNNNHPLPAPLNFTMSFSGDFRSMGTVSFYHTEVLSPPPDTTGPSVTGIQHWPASPGPADPITITADASDTQSNIQACELRVVGVSGWQAMDADDGSYDSQDEGVNLDIGTLSAGSYTVEVRCTDTAGNPTSPVPTHGVTVSAAAATAISTCVGMQNIRNDLTADYYLTGDIDCYAATHAGGALWNGGLGFEPIGDYSNPFAGSLDGKGHEIIGLYINRTGSRVGLFGVSGLVSNLTGIGLTDATVTGNNYVGALAGESYGNISDSFSTGNVTGTGFYVGGLVGQNGYSTLDYFANITNSHSTANVTANGNIVGGLVGINSNGQIINSFSTGSVTGGDLSVGGLVGTVGDGTDKGYIINSYSTGSVTGNRYIGGLVGHFINGNAIDSYSTGSVTGNSYLGGLVGHNGGSGTCTDSFWDTDTAYPTSNCGAGETGLPTAQMIQQSTFTGAGWDFTDIWQINDGTSYPCLQWQGGVGSCPAPSVPAGPTWVFQEDSDETDCANEACDSNWGTYEQEGMSYIFYFNYTIPLGAQDSSLLQVRDGCGGANAPVNLSLNSLDWSSCDLRFMGNKASSLGSNLLYWYGWDGSGWTQLRMIGGCGDGVPGRFYEEGIWWEVTEPPGWFYQECPGSAACSGTNWHPSYPCSNIYDGDWNTYGGSITLGEQGHYVYINYSKPVGAKSSSLWQVMDKTPAVNISIPAECWALCPLQFRVSSWIYMAQMGAVWYCYDGSGWQILRDDLNYDRAVEEAMWWDIGAMQGWIYQECADFVACSGNWDPAYPCDNAYDGNWSSRGVNDGSSLATVYWNYTKPEGALSSSQWQIRYQTMVGPQSYNVSIPVGCWQQELLQFTGSIEYSGLLTENYFRCWDGSSWSLVGSTQSKSIYEEGMWWDFG